MIKESYLPVIQTNPLFQKLSQEELLLLANTMSPIKEYRRGGIIHLQNEQCSSLDVILEGNIVIQRLDEAGKVLTVAAFAAGDTFGGNLLFADQNRFPMTVSASSDCVILHLDRQLLVYFCQKNQNFFMEFVRTISNKATLVSDKLNTVAMKSIRQQIIDFLAKESVLQGSFTIELHLSKKEWAENLGIPRPSLSRELKKMKEEGLIDYSRNWISIKDEDILAEL
ncbi:RmlC-like jelly roll fold [Syntrophomonas zehnderi OL-4]|uniref:RmlC-like jelly roll fold n=1 Tax=Syntrophomonas zehnderi OL-4 TaxID=690567 RepID=A0A0E4C990_9FIRM|nr:RmlC-like jelly roll fold [Syntrophomonas zehnderi OL-4]